MIDVRQHLGLPSAASGACYSLPLLERRGIANVSHLHASGLDQTRPACCDSSPLAARSSHRRGDGGTSGPLRDTAAYLTSRASADHRASAASGHASARGQ